MGGDAKNLIGVFHLFYEQVTFMTNISPTGACGCRARKTKKPLPLPQLPASERPQEGWRGVVYKKNQLLPEWWDCMLCDTHAKNQNSIQQHCRKHFPTEYACETCGDTFHLFTEYQHHFLYKCSDCGKTLKGGLKAHETRCKKKERPAVATKDVGTQTPNQLMRPKKIQKPKIKIVASKLRAAITSGEDRTRYFRALGLAQQLERYFASKIRATAVVD